MVAANFIRVLVRPKKTRRLGGKPRHPSRYLDDVQASAADRPLAKRLSFSLTMSRQAMNTEFRTKLLSVPFSGLRTARPGLSFSLA